MKKIKLFGALLLSFGMMASPIVAEENEEPYSYTIRIYRGNHGYFKDAPNQEYMELELGYGEALPSLNAQDLIVTSGESGKPYIPGTIKVSGEDLLSDTVYLGGSPVTADQDYVVTYNLLLDPVEYTINYMDTRTRQPIAGMEPSKYTGNLNEQVVMSFPYIEGYSPQARNARFTLEEGKSHNFNFWYEPIEAPGTIPGNTTTVTDTETETVTEPGTTPATTPETTPDTEEGPTPAPTPGGEDATTPPAGDETDNPTGPQDIVDIEDDNVPLAGPEENENGDASKSFLSMPALLGMGALALLLIGGIVYGVMKKKKEA